MHTTLTIIFWFQCIAAGYVFRDQIEWADCLRKRFKALLYALSVQLFGLAILAVLLLFVIAGALYRFIWCKLHLTFIFKYVVFRKELAWTARAHAGLGAKVRSLNPKWYQLSDKIFIWCYRWIENKYVQTT